MPQAQSGGTLDLQALTGKRLGPYRSFNPVSRVQVWQWCSAMGDRNPLYLDDGYRANTEFNRVVAPPAMMQMWTMRDINMEYALGSTDAPPYEIFDILSDNGFPGNVAVSYDISFHRYLQEGDRAHHYTTVVNISDLKQTALGAGHFVTERVEYLDQDEALFAEALITYFQYRPAGGNPVGARSAGDDSRNESPAERAPTTIDYRNFELSDVKEGQPLPELDSHHPQAYRWRGHRHPGFHRRAPQRGRRARRGDAGYLHEHPHHLRPLRPLPERLGRATEPPGEAGLQAAGAQHAR